MDIERPSNKIAPDKVAEVVSAGTTEFVAQCYEVHRSPPFGSLVRTGVEEKAIYGIVYSVSTASIEPGRRPIARGREEDSEEAIYQANPQLKKLLRTDLTALIIGFKENGKIHHYLPAQPPHIHSFVLPCDAAEVFQFSQSLVFLNLMLSARIMAPAEELVAASIRQMSLTWPEPEIFLVKAGKELSLILTNDLNRFYNILSRIK